jgi:hypothetical protein
VIVLWVSTTNVFIWILVDIPIMFFLWLFGIASTGCLSDVAHWFRALASNGYSSGR